MSDKQRDDDARLGMAALGLIPPTPSDAAVIQAAAQALKRDAAVTRRKP